MGKILVVDDVEDSVKPLMWALSEEGHEVFVARSGEKALESIAATKPDLLLLDITMPGMSGIEVLQRLKQDEELASIPVIMVSGCGLDERVVHALDVGAVDYVTKPYSIKVLSARVQTCLRLKASQDQLRQVNQQLETLASVDDLTGLYNRRAFSEFAKKELTRAQRHRRPVVMGIMDIDHFKVINDRYGHAAGDAILKQLSNLCLRHFRSTDIVARYGGEEFSICLSDTTLIAAEKAADRFVKAVSVLGFNVSTDAGVEKINITCSIGLAESDFKNPDLQAQLERADKALYQAKSGGRNQVISFKV